MELASREHGAAGASYMGSSIEVLAGCLSLDAFGEDTALDGPFPTTVRRLKRMMTVACDVGARFEREKVSCDATTWMVSPLRMFSGASPLIACQDRRSFVRATLMHGLSLGIDADPLELDLMLTDEEAASDEWYDADAVAALRGAECFAGDQRLYTCAIEGRIGDRGRHVQSFWAMIAPDEKVVRRRLRLRYGERLAAAADVTVGFEGEGMLARSLLSPSIRRLLAAVSLDPLGEIGTELDLLVEQRFSA